MPPMIDQSAEEYRERSRSDATPFGLCRALGRCPQGRRGVPTLGFGTESRWDSRPDARLCGSNCSDTLEKRPNLRGAVSPPRCFGRSTLLNHDRQLVSSGRPR